MARWPAYAQDSLGGAALAADIHPTVQRRPGNPTDLASRYQQAIGNTRVSTVLQREARPATRLPGAVVHWIHEHRLDVAARVLVKQLHLEGRIPSVTVHRIQAAVEVEPVSETGPATVVISEELLLRAVDSELAYWELCDALRGVAT